MTKKVWGIDTDEALHSPQRIANNVKYILEHYDRKTKQQERYSYSVITNVVDVARSSKTQEEKQKMKLGASTASCALTPSPRPYNTTGSSRSSRKACPRASGCALPPYSPIRPTRQKTRWEPSATKTPQEANSWILPAATSGQRGHQGI